MKGKREFIETNNMLVREFDRYILEHPEFADKIPDGALIIMQLEEDEAFNQWAQEMGQAVAENNPQLYVTITAWKPVRSRIEKLKIEQVA